MLELRNHMQADHENADINTAFYKLYEYLKIDITELKCKECSLDIDDVDTLMTHLSTEHNIDVNFEVPFGVFPFKQTPDGLFLCVCCGKTFTKFIMLKSHVGLHFKSLSCDKCGSAFVTEAALRNHTRAVQCLKTNYKSRDAIAAVTDTRTNAQIILECSTAYPFRIWKNNFNCIFCRVQSIDPCGLRQHMSSRHMNYDVNKAFYKRLGKEFVKIDVTNLQCKLCFVVADLNALVTHLKTEHQQPITDAQLGVLPFTLGDGTRWACAICPNEFPDFESLSKHTTGHFNNYVCDTCGEGFITESSLLAHTKIPHDNKYKCNRCVAAFCTAEERLQHVKSKHAAQLYTCTHCEDKPRFSTWNLRKRHLIEFHNYAPGAGQYECTTCQKSFKTRSAKYNHMERTHRMKKDSDVKYPCASCARTFTTKATLESHIAKKHYDV